MKTRLVLWMLAVCIFASPAVLARMNKIAPIEQSPRLSATFNQADNATTVSVTLGDKTVASVVKAGNITLVEEGDVRVYVPTSVLAELRDDLASNQTTVTAQALGLVWAQMEAQATTPRGDIPPSAISPISPPQVAARNKCGDWRSLKNRCLGDCTATGKGECGGCTCVKSAIQYVGGIEQDATRATANSVQLAIYTNTQTGQTNIMVHDPDDPVTDETTAIAIITSNTPPRWDNAHTRMFMTTDTVSALRDALLDKPSNAAQAFTAWANIKVRESATYNAASATGPGGLFKDKLIGINPVIEDRGCGDWKGLSGDCKGNCTTTDTTKCTNCTCSWTSIRFVGDISE